MLRRTIFLLGILENIKYEEFQRLLKVLPILGDDFWKNRKLLRSDIKVDVDFAFYIENLFGKLMNNINFFLEIVKFDEVDVYRIFYYAGPNVRNDRRCILESLSQHGVWNSGSVLKDLDEVFRNDRVFVEEAVRNTGCSFVFASEELKKDRALVLTAVKNGADLSMLNDEFKTDVEVVLTAVRREHRELRNVIHLDDFEIFEIGLKARQWRYARGSSLDLVNQKAWTPLKEIVIEILLPTDGDFEKNQDVLIFLFYMRRFLNWKKNFGLEKTKKMIFEDLERMKKVTWYEKFRRFLRSKKCRKHEHFVYFSLKEDSGLLLGVVDKKLRNDTKFVSVAVENTLEAIYLIGYQLLKTSEYLIKLVEEPSIEKMRLQLEEKMKKKEIYFDCVDEWEEKILKLLLKD